MRGNVPEHSINLNRICHTERSEVSQTVFVKVNPSPQSSAIRHAVSLDSTMFCRFS